MSAEFPPFPKQDFTASEVKNSLLAEPEVKVVPNTLWYSPYEVTRVGTSTGPLTVGPMIAAPATVGAGAMNEISFSLANTPGEINVSAMFRMLNYFSLL